MYLGKNMFIGWYRLTVWEVNFGEGFCMGLNMVIGKEKLLGYFLKKGW